ncbi:MAG: Nudix family hydrolase [Rugosibacter sp.]|nr:Nudix family hydrolase [Rugosibacter sp.]
MKITRVAAAVIERPDGQFLLGQRAADTVYAGYWEFPGGKIEAGETPKGALIRELHEELGITVVRADPWLRREHVYEHAHVQLYFFRVRAWQGDITPHVHSALRWQMPAAPSVQPMLPANAPILAALNLPAFYAITHAATIGVDAQLAALDRALARGLKLVQLREPQLDANVRRDFVHAAVKRCHAAGARVLIHSDIHLAREAGADGVHLTARQLMATATRPDFPRTDAALVAASCHSIAEMHHAAQLGCDFVVYGPVLETATHPGRKGLGWERFAAAVSGQMNVTETNETDMSTLGAVSPAPTFPPIYALGGLSPEDIDTAWVHGAHGVAAIRSAWQADQKTDLPNTQTH